MTQVFRGRWCSGGIAASVQIERKRRRAFFERLASKSIPRTINGKDSESRSLRRRSVLGWFKSTSPPGSLEDFLAALRVARRVSQNDERKNNTPRKTNREKKAYQNGNFGKGKSSRGGCARAQPPTYQFLPDKWPTSSSFDSSKCPARRSWPSARPGRPYRAAPWRSPPLHQHTSDRLHRFLGE